MNYAIQLLEKERNIVNSFALSEGLQLPSYKDDPNSQQLNDTMR